MQDAGDVAFVDAIRDALETLHVEEREGSERDIY